MDEEQEITAQDFIDFLNAQRAGRRNDDQVLIDELILAAAAEFGVDLAS